MFIKKDFYYKLNDSRIDTASYPRKLPGLAVKHTTNMHTGRQDPPSRHILVRLGLSLLLIMALSWLLIVAFFYCFQEKLVFYPACHLAHTPADIGLAYRDVYFPGQDGVRLHGWYVAARQPQAQAQAQVLFLHGNAGNISHRLDTLKLLHDLQLSSFIIDYRGYGLSEGRPSEAGTYADALAAWAYLQAQGIAADEIILMGRSLGGAIAAWLAAEISAEGPAALILDSTFTRLADVASHHYGFLPSRWITRMEYNTEQHLAALQAPLLLLHSSDDELIPYALGRRLYAAANTDKALITLSGRHNESFINNRAQYARAISDFLHTHLQ